MLSLPFFSGIISTGTCTIPVGTRVWQVDCISGSAYINGMLLLGGKSLSCCMPDSRVLLGAPISVGVTGGAASANYTTVFYAQ